MQQSVFTNMPSSYKNANILEQKKVTCLHKKKVKLLQDWFKTLTWWQFHCFGTLISFPLKNKFPWLGEWLSSTKNGRITTLSLEQMTSIRNKSLVKQSSSENHQQKTMLKLMYLILTTSNDDKNGLLISNISNIVHTLI